MNEMNICGRVLASKDVKSFEFQCNYCCRIVNIWSDFMMHIQTSHNPNDTSWIDNLIIKDEENSKQDVNEKEELIEIDNLTENCTIVSLPPAIHSHEDEVSSNFEKPIENNSGLKSPTVSLDDTIIDDEKVVIAKEFEITNDIEDEECLGDESSSKTKHKYNKAVKNLTFAKISPFTLAFIEEYSKYPVLYDDSSDIQKKMGDTRREARREAFQNISKKLNDEFDVELTPRDAQYGIYFVRDWYYVSYERQEKEKKNAAAPIKRKYRRCPEINQLYLEKCKFLPPKRSRDRFACSICGKTCNNRSGLQIHMFNAHQIGELPFKCSDCGQPFKHKSTMELHQKRAHLEKEHHCPHCPKSFSVWNDMDRHIRHIHFGERQFICETCGKPFRYALELKNHIAAIHTKIREHNCTLCPKGFYTARDLKDHMKGHYNIRDKVCQECGKSFTNCHLLSSHRQTHLRNKKFKCKYCPHRYATSLELDEHTTSKHNKELAREAVLVTKNTSLVT